MMENTDVGYLTPNVFFLNISIYVPIFMAFKNQSKDRTILALPPWEVHDRWK